MLRKHFQHMPHRVPLFLCFLLITFFFSAHIRFQQYETWKKTPDLHFVGERPMMTTADAPYFIQIARRVLNGTLNERDRLRNYPDGFLKKVTFSEQSIHYRSIPLLSLLMAKIAPWFGGNLYLAGILMIPVLASLFIIPLGLYFLIIDLPLVGLLGGLAGTFSISYFTRTSIGRIDTDMLNLFFPFLASLFILCASRTSSSSKIKNPLLFSALSGLTLYFYWWWYGKPGFTLVYFAILIVALAVNRHTIKTILASALLFILFSHPDNFTSGLHSIQSFLQVYWDIAPSSASVSSESTGQLSFPNLFSSITEAQHLSANQVMQRIFTNSILSWVGLLAMGILSLRYWKNMIPLLPVLFLGVMAFQSSQRFVMYLAPFAGMGFGLIITLSFQLLFWGSEYLGTKSTSIKALQEGKAGVFISKYKGIFQECLLYGAGILFFFWIAPQTAMSYVPAPTVPTTIYRTFPEIKAATKEDSALFTWWGYGYALTEATQRATFHDGGSFNNPKSYFVARGMLAQTQKELFNIINFIGSNDSKEVKEKSRTRSSLAEEIKNAKTSVTPVYVLFTGDLVGRFPWIYRAGSWDFETQRSEKKGFQKMNCQSFKDNVLSCDAFKIDLNSGLINQKIPLQQVLQVKNGKVHQEQNYGRKQGFFLEILEYENQRPDVYLMESLVFHSNFNQMFLLGRYDSKLYEESLNRVPDVRLFRVKNQ